MKKNRKKKYCPKCGVEIPRNNQYCDHCVSKILEEAGIKWTFPMK